MNKLDMQTILIKELIKIILTKDEFYELEVYIRTELEEKGMLYEVEHNVNGQTKYNEITIEEEKDPLPMKANTKNTIDKMMFRPSDFTVPNFNGCK